MIDVTRHRPLFDPAMWDDPIVIIGCGGLGSHLAWSIARLGVREIVLVDGDVLESHNLANQAYASSDVGKLKVEALAYALRRSLDVDVSIVPEFIREARMLAPVVFMCVDTMRDRKLIMDTCLKGNADVRYVFDGRMDASHGVVYSIDPNNPAHIALWEHYWFPDADAQNDGDGCGGKISVVYTAAIVAGMMAHEFVRWNASLNGGLPPAQRRDISLAEDRMQSDRW
ncbi:ThiF family adenylyltransferase [bacterium]|nr:ThiF family adenylyltransferase [bacterium]